VKNTGYVVRRATEHDVPGIVDCELEVWASLKDLLPEPLVSESIRYLKTPSAEADMLRRVLDPNRVVLVADLKGKIVGVARGGRREGGVFWLGFLGVRPGYRRRGIGSALLDAFIEEAKRSGAHKLCLYTSPVLIDAVKLYVSRGFVPEGLLRKHYYGMDLIHYSLFLE